MTKLPQKIIRIQHVGDVGNRIFQYFFGISLLRLVANARLIGINIPHWNIQIGAHEGVPARHLLIEGGHEFNQPRIAQILNSDLVDAVTCRVFGHRMEFLPALPAARELLSCGLDPSLGEPVPNDALLINIRGAEIMGGLHKDYMPLPLSFYELLVASSGLRPIFMGQIGDGPYFEALRNRFKTAQFWQSRGPLRDFNTIGNARQVVACTSSFSWLAVWLSCAAETIHLPVCGIFNPNQRSDIDVLPFPDRRYRYYKFPITKWLATEDQVRSLLHDDIATPVMGADEVAMLKLSKFRACV